MNERISLHTSPEPNTGCWLWTGYCGADGYPLIGMKLDGKRTHRVSRVLLGLRDPAHLFIGTPEDNSRDCSAKGRHKNSGITHCKRGHEFTAENTFIPRAGWRQCRTCRAADFRAAKARAKARQADVCPRPEGWGE